VSAVNLRYNFQSDARLVPQICTYESDSWLKLLEKVEDVFGIRSHSDDLEFAVRSQSPRQ